MRTAHETILHSYSVRERVGVDGPLKRPYFETATSAVFPYRYFLFRLLCYPQYEKISSLQKYVLDVATTQINEHTDLRINYELIKKGRSFHSIRFFVNRQVPQQMPIPFEDGVEEVKQLRALQNLEELEIRDPKLISQILGDAKKLETLFSFTYKHKTGKIKADKNPGGLFLKMVGLR